MSNNFDYIYKTAQEIDYYFLISTIPFGMVLNLINIFIYLRPNLNKTNMGFFYSILSIVNFLILIVYFFFMDSYRTMNYDLNTYSDISCIMITFIKRTLRSVPTWIETLITFDRFLLVLYPNRFNFMKNKINLSIIMFIMIIFLCIANSSNFFYYLSYSYKNKTYIDNNLNKTVYNGTYLVSISCTASKTVNLMGDLSAPTIKTFIPGIIMGILSFMIVKKVRRSRKEIKRIQSYNSNDASSKERQFTVSILCINSVFLTLNLPIFIITLIKQIYDNAFNYQDPYIKTIILSIYLITFDIANLYHSFMFFIFLIFNKLFLKEIILLTNCWRNI